MSVDEKIHGLALQHLTGKLHLEFPLAQEGEEAFIVGGATFTGEETGYGEGLARMQHTVQHAVGLESEDVLNQQVAALLAANAVAVPHQTALAVDDKVTPHEWDKN